MRVLVSGAGGFIGAHLDVELARDGHLGVAAPDVAPADPRFGLADRAGVDAVIHLSPNHVRQVLDRAFADGARLFLLLSTLGADPRSPRGQLALRGRAEETVRASGMPWVILRPEIIWGPGDVFTNELAHLLRHLPFVPIPRGRAMLAPIFAGDVAHALTAMLARPDLWRREWSLIGPEELPYAEVVARVAEAIDPRRTRRRLKVPAWSVRLGTALEERLQHRPQVSRALLDRLVAANLAAHTRADEVLRLPRRSMSVAGLRQYLHPERSMEEQQGLIA